MPKGLNPDHIAQILHALCDSPPDHTPNYHFQNATSLSLTAEEIKRKTPSLNNSERAKLIEALRFSRFVYHTDGNSAKKYRPFAEDHSGGRVIWKFGITEEGRVYLTIYDLLRQAHSHIHIPGTVPSELVFEVIPGSIRPATKTR